LLGSSSSQERRFLAVSPAISGATDEAGAAADGLTQAALGRRLLYGENFIIDINLYYL
jgi:hypothetical protein